MTDIVFKPEKAPVVAGRGLYRAYLNRMPLDLRFRAKTAGEADAMLQYLLTEQTKGKTLFVDPDLFTPHQEKDHDTEEKHSEKDHTSKEETKAAEGNRPEDPAAGPVARA